MSAILALVYGTSNIFTTAALMSSRLRDAIMSLQAEYKAWVEAYHAGLEKRDLDPSLIETEDRLNRAIDDLTQQLLNELAVTLARAAEAKGDHRAPVVEGALEALIGCCSKLGDGGLSAALRLCAWAEGRLPAGEPDGGPDRPVWLACRDLREHMDATADSDALRLAKRGRAAPGPAPAPAPAPASA